MFPKNKPLKSKKNLEEVRNRKCEVCGKPPPNDACHITTKRLIGDEMSNLMTLCRGEHMLQHLIGIRSFVERFNLPISFESGFGKRTDVDGFGKEKE